MDINNNKMVGILANVVIKPKDTSFSTISQIKIQNRASIPDNIEHWKKNYDDKYIMNFLLNIDKYHGQELDYSALIETTDGREKIFGQEIL